MKRLSVDHWEELAACREVGPETFFPVAEDGPMLEAEVQAAKSVCAGCPVRTQCLEYALGALAYGIAGGMTPEERRRLKAERRAAERNRGAA